MVGAWNTPALLWEIHDYLFWAIYADPNFGLGRQHLSLYDLPWVPMGLVAGSRSSKDDMKVLAAKDGISTWGCCDLNISQR